MEQSLANTDFADYLVAFGACSQDVADELARRAKESWVQLGRILVSSGKLCMKDVSEILGHQADHPRELFGDIAVELAFITREELDEALRTQSASCPHILDLAAADERVDQERYLEAARSYVRHVERQLDRLNDALLDCRRRRRAAQTP